MFGIIDAESKTDPSVPQWSSVVGWILAMLALVQIPFWFILTVYKDPNVTLWEVRDF